LPLFYQWLRNGTPLTDGGAISGSQTAQLTIASVTNGAAFSVIIANGAASVTSATVGVTINGAPTILTQPSNCTNVAGTPASFFVSAMGTAPLVCQWTKHGLPLSNGGNIVGGGRNVLSIAIVNAWDG